MQIRKITLRTADGLNPTPMAMSWVRDGVLMCGMDNEIAIYSQWREDSVAAAGSAAAASAPHGGGRDIADHRSLQESDILSIAQVVKCWPTPPIGHPHNDCLSKTPARRSRR